MEPEHERLITDVGKPPEAGQLQDPVGGPGDEPQRIKANLAAQGESLLTEANRVFTLAIPIILTEMLSFFSYLCSTAQAGATGAQALSAYTLAKTVYHIMGVSVVVGLGGAADTFVGQAYGAGNYSQVGTYTQRGCMINIIVGLLSVAVWWLSGDHIMLLLGQNPSVVSQASELLKLMSPSVVMWGVIFPLHAYFAGQGMVKPLAVIAALGAIATPFVNYIASVSLGFGIQGIAFANNILAGLNMLSLFVAMIWLHYQQPSGAKTWPGFQLAASLSEWPVYLRIALPSMAMICLDWWCFEFMTVISGLHPDASIQIGAMGIMFVTHSLGFIITAGFGTAAATRAANELGAGHGAAARRATIVCVISGFLGGLPIGLALFLRAEQWARLFTTNDQVVDTIVAAMPWLVLSIMSDSIDAVLSGVLRGCGRQMIGFVTNLVTFWFIGIPLAYHLDIVLDLGARGVWMALSGVSLIQAIILLVAVGRFDWDAEARRSLKLLASGQGVTAAEVRAAAGGPGGHHGVYEPLIGAEHA